MSAADEVKTERFDPRQGWPAGPWDDEPFDKVSWHDAVTDLACLMVRSPLGAWCGYVGVPPGHPWHGVSFAKLDADVHGGLSYGAPCDEDGKICHVPAPGQPADVFWVGFDCAHWKDVMPGMLALLDDKGVALMASAKGLDCQYRDADYVRQQVLRLARQVRDAA